MIKSEEKVLIASNLLERLSPLKIKILAHLLSMCPIIGYDADKGSPIRKPYKLSTRELCKIIKACRPVVLRELRELEEGSCIIRRHSLGKTKEIYVLDFPADQRGNMKKEELSATKSPLEKKVETLMGKVNLLSDFIKYLVGTDDFPINRIFDGVDFDAIRQDFYGKDLAPLPEEM